MKLSTCGTTDSERQDILMEYVLKVFQPYISCSNHRWREMIRNEVVIAGSIDVISGSRSSLADEGRDE